MGPSVILVLHQTTWNKDSAEWFLSYRATWLLPPPRRIFCLFDPQHIMMYGFGLNCQEIMGQGTNGYILDAGFLFLMDCLVCALPMLFWFRIIFHG